MSKNHEFIPLSVPNFEGNEKKYVDDAVEQGWVSTGGAYITKMEESLEQFLNVPKVACVQSGTSALHLSLVEAGVQPGDVVLVPPVTFIAAVNPVRYQFATPVFIDCDDSFCMDPVKLKVFCEKECERAADGTLTYKEHPVRAIVVVHVFGNVADMESIMEIAEQFQLKVVEDATEALGTKYTEGKYKDKYAGTIGDFGCFSFNGNKIITTGGGGAVTSRDASTVDHIRYLSTQAKDDPHYYIHNEIGYNYRMTNLQAALGVAQMEELPEFICRKQRNYDIYKRQFEGFEYAELMSFRTGTDSNKWFYSLKINRDKISVSMKEIITALEEQKIGTRTIWGLINEQIPYREYVTYQLEKAPFYSARILNIPCSTNLSEQDILTVSEIIKDTLTQMAKKND